MDILLLVLKFVFIVAQIIIAFYLVMPMFFLIIHLLRNLFLGKNYRKQFPFIHPKEFDFGLIITAHQDTRFIYPLVDSILKQTHGKFTAYVVADGCDISDLHFDDNRVVVLSPQPALNAKIKSIAFGLSHFREPHDAVIILDVDSLLHPNFLQVINTFFQQGFKAVQANFKAKNTDSSFAKMDAIGDMFNFFLERQMRMELGLSAAIWGSGVAVDTSLYKEVTYQHFLGGFDKKLQAHIVQNVDQIAFAEDAIIYDEKITDGQSLEKQRTRWIHAQFKYISYGFEVLWTGIKKGSINLIYFALVLVRPPLFMVIGLGLVFTAISYFIGWTPFITWLIIMAIFVLGLAGIVSIKSNSNMVKYVLSLPAFAGRQMKSLLKIKRASKSFLKTEHKKIIYIDDILNASPKNSETR